MDDLSKLIREAQEGDKDAFGDIYKIFYKRIFRYCKFNTGEAALAQDLCQETFFRAWKSLPSFSHRKGGSFQAFLFRIARNLIIDHWRKRKDLRLADYQDLETDENLEQGINREDSVQKVQKAISKLDEVERQIIILHYFEEMTGAEIAKIVGMREGAVRVRTYRILKKMKEILKREND